MKRSNLLLAILCLFLGAALADWLSTRDAYAQALPPSSSGGTSYTHPSAISLANGIDSQDGGTLQGRVSMKRSSTTNNANAPSTLSVETQDAADSPYNLLLQGRAGVGFPSIAWAESTSDSTVGFIKYSGVITDCWGFGANGYAATMLICPYVGSGSTMSRLLGHASSSSYGISIESYNGSAYEVAADSVGGWWRVPKSGAGAPTGTDCDAAGEFGRKYQDTTNLRDYTCYGTAGWKYAQLL